MATRRQHGGNRAAALKVLGLPANTSENNIKKAYRKKSLIYHPDREGGNIKLFQRLGAAYEFLMGKRNSFNNNTKHKNNNNKKGSTRNATNYYAAAASRKSKAREEENWIERMMKQSAEHKERMRQYGVDRT